MLTATPLENSPEDIYACVDLLDSSIFTTVTDFRKEYGLFYSAFNPYKISVWDQKKLATLKNRFGHILHQADKYKDPTIAAQFPNETWEDVVVDMSTEDQKVYDSILYDLLTDDSEDILSKLLIMRLICDNPSLINYSNSMLAQEIAKKVALTDSNSSKLHKLREMLEEIEGKIVLFNMYNDLGSNPLFSYVKKWGFKAVLYDGNSKQKQDAEDRFRNDPDIKIFVSSDKGSDSINLEKGSTVINYNLPWKYTTLLQRVNRINRITSNHENIYYYNLLVANSMEDRKLEVISKKKNLQDIIFNGGSSHAPARELSNKDLSWILTG